MQQRHHVGDHGPDFLRNRGATLQGFVEIHGLRTVVLFEHEVLVVHHLAQFGDEVLPVVKIAQAQAAAGRLVFVGGADAAQGRADSVAAARLFPGKIEPGVIRQNELTGGADAQSFLDRHTLRFQAGSLFQECVRLEDHAVADAALDARPQDAGGNEVQHRLPAFDDQRVTRIVPPLGAHHGSGFFGQQVDDLALAFVPPLGAHDDDVSAHVGAYRLTGAADREGSPAVAAKAGRHSSPASGCARGCSHPVRAHASCVWLARPGEHRIIGFMAGPSDG